MKKYSINNVISGLNLDQSKVYYYSYNNYGFELGFGKAGKYSGHSHLYFFDILFSTEQIFTNDGNGQSLQGKLILVPPRTYLGDVEIDNFFFLKFCPSKDRIILPDKIEEVLNEGLLEAYSGQVLKNISWFKDHFSEQSFIEIKLDDETMTINFGYGETILICK